MAFTFGSTPVGSIQKKPTQTTKKPTAQQKTDFRKKEQQATKTSIGTAGPKVNVTGDPSKDRSEPTAAQKIAFREQEETYLTQSPGTVGDKYYKNPEGTGTGQGGSGIPKDTTKQTSSGVVTTATPPVERPESIQPTVTSPVVSTDSNTSQSTLSPLSPTETAEVFTPTYTFLEEDDVVRTGRGKEIQRGTGVGLLTLSLKPSVNLFNRSKPFFDGMELKGEVKF